jgi:hypothetical protein
MTVFFSAAYYIMKIVNQRKGVEEPAGKKQLQARFSEEFSKELTKAKENKEDNDKK